MKNEESEQALDCLKKAESILEDHTNEGKDVDRNLIIIVLYNQACCYQRMSMLEECSNYLDGTIYNLQQKLSNFEDQDQDIQEMLQLADTEYGFQKKSDKFVYGDSEEDQGDLYGMKGNTN